MDDYFRDRQGRIIGRLDGDFIRDRRGDIIARYDRTDNLTRNREGKVIGEGDQRMVELGRRLGCQVVR